MSNNTTFFIKLLYQTAFAFFFVMMTVVPCRQVFADAEHSDYATEGEQTLKEVVKHGMIPIHSQDIKEGTYDVEVLSSSSFFKVNAAKLHVKNGKMTADLTLFSHSYLLLYMGTGQEASAAPASDYISYEEQKDGSYVFTIPVSNLNEGIYCAAYSKNRDKWYDRMLVFDAASLPEDAVAFTLPDYDEIDKAVDYYQFHSTKDNQDNVSSGTSPGSADSASAMTATEPMKINKADGEYSIEVNMTGGSGRASISSPTLFIVKEGKAYARLIWSSTYYDYMIVGGQKYNNETTDGGNSTFTIPVSKMDRIIPVIADTTAMGDPVEIEYSLTFYQSTIGDKGLIPQEAAKKVLIFALIVIIVGGILNYFVKKRRKGR